MRIIIYTGKGGVGKTSVAAATALKAATMGYKTVVISTDAAHSLSDSLEFQLSGVLTPVAKNLDGIEVDIQHELENRWKEIQAYLSDFLASQGMDAVTAKEMAVFPGMELMSALFYVEEFHKSKKYDVVVMDTAPTADTLRLLAFPDTASWYFDRLFHMLRNVLRVARATVGKFMSTPLPTEKFLTDLENLKGRLAYVQDLLTDPEITSVRLVVNPEKMVIAETQRAYTYLCLYGYTVESIIINRVIPDELGDTYFKAKLEEQKRYLKQIEEIFSPLKTIKVRLMPKEVLGIKALEMLGDELFGKGDPTEVENASVLAIRLPYPMDQKLELYTRKDDLTLQLGAFKKSIVLPHSMTNKKVLGADMEDGWLKIRFEVEKHGKRKGRKRRRSRKEARKAH